MENISKEQQAANYASFLNRAFKHDTSIKPANKREYYKLINSEKYRFYWLNNRKEKQLTKAKSRFKQAAEIFLSLSTTATEKMYFKVMLNDIEEADTAEFLYDIADVGLKITERFK